MRYAVVIGTAGARYSGYVPDLPGCVAAGATVARVRALLKAAIPFHIEGLIEGLIFFFGALHKIKRLHHDFIVNGLHALTGKGASVIDFSARKTMNYATRTKFLFEFWIFGVIHILGLFLCIEVIEVAKELIKAMGSWQHVIAIAQVVFTKLTRFISTCF